MNCENFVYGGLLSFFEQISDIPRPTFHEDKIADYLCDFARARGLEYYRDEVHNVLIKKSGTEGRESEAPLMLQAHTDMVCEKNDDTEHDFLTEGLKLYVENGLLRARGTTLGADDGYGVAVMLYILDGAEGHVVSHPPLECLFTAAEEVGLDGAKQFDYSKLAARRMINLDSADDNQVLTGCAGGNRTTLVYTPSTEAARGAALSIFIKGLAGGHSGEDIDRGRASANKLMGRVLLSLTEKIDYRIASINGGTKDNAITREAQAVVLTDKADELKTLIRELQSEIAAELVAEDGGFFIECESCDMPNRVMTKESADEIVLFLSTVQTGVFEMNKHMRNLVEFSRNLGVVKTESDLSSITFKFLSRSPQASQIAFSIKQLEAYARHYGMSGDHGDNYPGWLYAPSSPIRETYASVYKELWGKDIEVVAIHAGLECAIIKERIPDMDIIACGPVLRGLHSPDEYMDLASYERFFKTLKAFLEK